MFRLALIAVLAALAVPAVASARHLPRKQVKALQRALHVRADGAIGPRTRRALRRFERRHDLKADGRPDAEVLQLLGVTVPDDDAPDTATQPAAAGVAAAVEAARTAIGTPYASGGTTEDGFDCSGLVQWAFGQAGIDLPRTSYDQYAEGTAVDEPDIEAGDLVFFDTAGDGASHVGIATGPDTVISATSSKGVMEHDIDDDYWGSHYLGARRLEAEPTDE